MGWRDGCAPRPTVPAGAAPVTFDFEAADAVGHRLDIVRRRLADGLAARAAAQVLLVDWAGGHRRRYDERRRAQEAILAGADLGAQLARLRAAWDEAAAAQARANRVVDQERTRWTTVTSSQRRNFRPTSRSTPTTVNPHR